MSTKFTGKIPDEMIKHFARRCYERNYAIYRRAYRLGGLMLALECEAILFDKYMVREKMPHILKASAYAYRSYLSLHMNEIEKR